MNTATAIAEIKTTSRLLAITVWALRVISAVILLQTLFFKFAGAPETKYIFGKVGAFVGANLEPWGRIGSGVIELIAALLILHPRTTWLGSLIAAGVMSGAILSHLTFLGIEVQGDGGLLFGLALAVFACSLVLIFLSRTQIPIVGDRFR